jgi:hypothetical protein
MLATLGANLHHFSSDLVGIKFRIRFQNSYAEWSHETLISPKRLDLAKKNREMFRGRMYHVLPHMEYSEGLTREMATTLPKKDESYSSSGIPKRITTLIFLECPNRCLPIGVHAFSFIHN